MTRAILFGSVLGLVLLLAGCHHDHHGRFHRPVTVVHEHGPRRAPVFVERRDAGRLSRVDPYRREAPDWRERGPGRPAR